MRSSARSAAAGIELNRIFPNSSDDTRGARTCASSFDRNPVDIAARTGDGRRSSPLITVWEFGFGDVGGCEVVDLRIDIATMEVIREKEAMREWSRSQRKAGHRIAFVPTMGFLHCGHLSLIEEAKKRADKVVVSIYVNPSQFAPGEDLSSYPRDFDGDLRKLRPLDVDVVFNPYDLYVRAEKLRSHNEGDCGHETWIRVERLEKPLCGIDRPIFFTGVVTVVAKLFNIIEPDVAVFGKKDYQQWRIICRMVRDLDFAVEIVGCPLIREKDGLAMSSRNVRLSAAERQDALSISRSLREVEGAVKSGEVDVAVLEQSVCKAITDAGGKVDYAQIVDKETLQEVEAIRAPVVFAVAARFGSVRLLDNMELEPST